MKRPLSLAVRIGAIAAAGLLVSAGLAFAARSEDSGQATTAQPPLVEVAEKGTEYATPTTAPPPTRTSTASVARDATVPPVASAEPGTATPASSASAMTPVSVPRPSPTSPAPPTPPPASGPVTDLPAYTDIAVLALAANAILPSGMTFRECVELPPSHEKWPTPVHLYYEGKGRWLVETHVSEVQVVFDEATATFKPRNFAPSNPGCR